MVTLTDGSQVSREILEKTWGALKALEKKNPFALSDLFEKCKDSSYQIVENLFGDTKKILREYSLMNSKDEIGELVTRIVITVVTGEEIPLTLTFPKTVSRL